MEIYTIGFTQITAREFFGRLTAAGIEQLVDIRLNNRSQLAGFAKKEDLAFFLRAICDISYRHLSELAPSPEILAAYKKRNGSWEEFERGFLQLLAERQIEAVLDPELFRPRTVLLCSEPTAERCHRRLVLEYLHSKWGAVRAIDL